MDSILKLLVLSLTCWSCTSSKKTPSVTDRSYQLGVPIVNGAQGLQFYSSGTPVLYHNVPATVLVPGQIGVLNLPAGLGQSAILPTEPSPALKPTYSQPRPYGHYSKKPSPPNFTIEQSVDLSDSTPPSPAVSTYGPPKTVDVQHRRPHSHRLYHRHKGHPYPTRGPRPPNNRPLMYTHVHKGHLHTHYIPPSGYYKSPKPTYSPPSPPSTPPPHPPDDENPPTYHNHHAFPPSDPQSGPSGNLVRFPETHSDLTQALIGKPGVINNYDANLPVRIPKPKPNRLEVQEILKNADFHFVDVLENRPTTTSSPLNAHGPQSHSQSQPSPYAGINPYEDHFQNSALFSPNQEEIQPSTAFHDSSKVVQNFRHYSDVFNQRFQVSPNFPSNHLDQDLGNADTVKVPVAVFKGIVPSMFPLPVKRSDNIQSAGEQSKPSDFVPSKSSSDWIPVTGVPKSEKVRNLNQFGDEYFSDLHQQPSGKTYQKKVDVITNEDSYFMDSSASQNYSPPHAEKLVGDSVIYGNKMGSPAPSNFRDFTVRPVENKRTEKVGDIISGRIPGDHNPFAVIGDSNSDRRVGTMIDSGSVSTGKFGDSSDLVVSSVIKFS